MAVKVYIRMNDGKSGGVFEVDEFPIAKESGLINVIYAPGKGKRAGQRIPKQINVANISEIEPVNGLEKIYDSSNLEFPIED